MCEKDSYFIYCFVIIVCGCIIWNNVSVKDDVCSKYKLVLEDKYYEVYKELKNGKDKKYFLQSKLR